MMILVIGSAALRYYGIEVDRIRHDIDTIASVEAIAEHVRDEAHKEIRYTPDGDHILSKGPAPNEMNTLIWEYEIAWPESSGARLIEILEQHPELVEVEGSIGYSHPGVVLALKLSHRYKKNSPHFRKTMDDIIMLREMGFEVPKCLKGKKWFKKREKETYKYSHPKLMGVKKGEFFNDDGIDYVYDHDSIHAAVQHLDRPAYSFFQPEGEEVGTSKEAFFAQPLRIQLLAVLEESYVLSLERSIIPFNTFDDEEKCCRAFDMALMKVCSSITSGWFREFAWENFHLVEEMYDIEYVRRFQDRVAEGKVRPYVKEQ